MSATAPQTLFTGGKCYDCYGASAVQMMILSLLARIATGANPNAMTDPQSLITYGKCFNCYGASLVEMMMLALLDQISISGGGGGSTQVYEGRDPLPPDDPTKAAFSYPVGGGTITQWSIEDQIWV